MEPQLQTPPPTAGGLSASEGAKAYARLRKGYYVLEALNSLATAYYFNYLFFYLKERFGFGDRDNLLASALYGIIYCFAAWYAGRFAQRRGYFFALRLGLGGMAACMIIGGAAPRLLGYSHAMMVGEWFILGVWTFTVCFTWPSLQSLLSRNQSPEQTARTAGIYNVVWSAAAALAYLTSGMLLDKFGGEILFWVSAGINLMQLAMLPRLQRLSLQTPEMETTNPADHLPALNPRPIAKARKFVLLAWIGNPFAYVAMYGVIPIIPKLSEHLGLTPTDAGLICSIWFWTRLVVFIWFWQWTGWHYRFDWLLGAFITLILGFLMILLSSHIWMLVVGQIIFGLAIGLMYYSSLFYAMDAGESKGKRGGFHEAAIGLGIFIGPSAGVTALHLFPQNTHAGTWGICVLLVIGLALFVGVQQRNRT